MEKVIIFDMDGVIVDSEYTFLDNKTEMLREEGIDTDVSYQYQYMGTTFEFMWQAMKEEFGLPKTVKEYIAEMNRRRQAIVARDGVRPIKHAVRMKTFSSSFCARTSILKRFLFKSMICLASFSK